VRDLHFPCQVCNIKIYYTQSPSDQNITGAMLYFQHYYFAI